MKQHTTIIGGGVVGLSLAWELSKRGSRVTLLERDHIGKATSWSAAGILPPANLCRATDPLDQLRGLSHELFPQWIQELDSVTGIDSGLRRCGGWYLADTSGERAAMVGMTGYWGDLDIACEEVSTDELARREPALSTWASGRETASAWWVPDEYQIRSPHYLQALARACRSSGVELIENAAVVSIDCGSDSASAQVEGRWFESDSIVVCSGAWTGQVAKQLRLQSSLIPVRGQMLLLRTESPPVRSVVNVGQRYLVSREDGHTLVGSSEEESGFDLSTDEPTLQSLMDFAVSLIPELATAGRAGAWTGLRPLTFDGFPMIGRVPDTSNLYVAAGHFRSGMHLSPATAVTLADLILGDKPRINLDAFGVGKQQSRPGEQFAGSPQTHRNGNLIVNDDQPMTLEPPGSIAVVGAGPLGVEAALYGRFLGYDVQLIEAAGIGNSMEARRDDSLPMLPDRCLSPLALGALGAQADQEATADLMLPVTCGQWIDQFLVPLTDSDLLRGRLRMPARVVKIETIPVEPDEEGEDTSEIPPDYRLSITGDDSCDYVDCESVILATGQSSEIEFCFPTPASYVFSVGRDVVDDDPERQLLAGLREIVAIYSQLGGREDLDLYRPRRV